MLNENLGLLLSLPPVCLFLLLSLLMKSLVLYVDPGQPLQVPAVASSFPEGEHYYLVVHTLFYLSRSR